MEGREERGGSGAWKFFTEKNRCLQEGIYHLTEKTFRLFSQSYRITPLFLCVVSDSSQNSFIMCELWDSLLAAKRAEQESLQDLTELISGAAGDQYSNLRDSLCSRWVAGVSVATAWPVEINQACEQHFFFFCWDDVAPGPQCKTQDSTKEWHKVQSAKW